MERRRLSMEGPGGSLSGQSLTTEGKGDEFRTSSVSGESESGDGVDGKLVADFSEEGETPGGTSKLAKLHEIISWVASMTKSPKGTRENNPNKEKTPNEYNLTIPSAYETLTVEELMSTILIPNSGNRGSLSQAMRRQSPVSQEYKGSSWPNRQREQDKLDWAGTFEKSREALGCYTYIVKHSRQVDHLLFPLANAPDAWLLARGKVTVLSASAHTP